MLNSDSSEFQGTTGSRGTIKTALEKLEQEMKYLSKEIRRLLRRDRRDRADWVSQEVATELEAKHVHEAYERLSGWYRRRGGRQSRPTESDLEAIRVEFSTLYKATMSPGPPLPINVQPAEIDDSIPQEPEIVEALHRMRRGRQPGPSGIRVEHLLDWHKGYPNLWEKVVKLVQLSFSGESVATAFWQGILVLIPKAQSDKFRGIALLEAIYKLCSSIIHVRLQNAIEFHPGLHGFRMQRGTDTAILEAKLQMQLAAREGDPLFQVFLDLTKAYDTLDRERTMAILEGYGVGPNIRHFIETVWDGDTLVPKFGSYFGSTISAKRGVRQGDVLSPIIFNIVVDCVLREWCHHCDSLGIFYADDGRLADTSAPVVQKGLDLFGELFARVGLKINPNKTKVMICVPPTPYGRQSPIAYKRRYDQTLESYSERQAHHVPCPECNRKVRISSLPNHKRNIHKIYTPPQHILELETGPPCTYTVSIRTAQGTRVPCPVPGCPAIPVSRFHMRAHFCRMHPTDTIVVKEEGPLPRCPNCQMFLFKVDERHLRSETCRKLTLQSRSRQHAREVQRAVQDVSFTVNGKNIETVSEFRYLGRILSDNDLDDAAIQARLAKAQQCWGRMRPILAADHASARTMGRFYMAVVQAVLLHGSSSWVISTRSQRRLDSFHHRCARYMAHRHIQQRPDDSWDTPNSVGVLDQCGLSSIGTYIAKRKTTLLHNFAKPHSTFYRQCLNSKPMATVAHRQSWWTSST